jgi:protein-disulfide isomerase
MEKIQNNYAIPVAIVVAGALVAGALFFALSNNGGSVGTNQPAPNIPEEVDTTDQVRPVTQDDHIKGSSNPKVTIVEYSDFECPFCKRFHETMNQVLSEEDDVAWVFRQFPLDQLHPRNARRAAIASECAGDLGGEQAFWTFTDGYFEATPANDQTDLDTLVPQLVAKAGIDQATFDACVASGKYDKHVQDDVDNAVATGGRGTPWSIVITASGDTVPLNGAQPLSAVKQLIEFAREN